MKRIFMICCMIATTVTYCQAQAPTPPPTPDAVVVVSKSEFTEKVKELDKQIGKEKTEEANAIFNDITKMAYDAMGGLRHKARAATTDADKKKYTDLTMSQRMLFAEVLKLKGDMPANRKAINDKLNEFAGKME